MQSLNRPTNQKDVQSKSKGKGKVELATDADKTVEDTSNTVSRENSPASDHYAELTPSEDEGDEENVEIPSQVNHKRELLFNSF